MVFSKDGLWNQLFFLVLKNNITPEKEMRLEMAFKASSRRIFCALYEEINLINKSKIPTLAIGRKTTWQSKSDK